MRSLQRLIKILCSTSIPKDYRKVESDLSELAKKKLVSIGLDKKIILHSKGQTKELALDTQFFLAA